VKFIEIHNGSSWLTEYSENIIDPQGNFEMISYFDLMTVTLNNYHLHKLNFILQLVGAI
jgi:hypothetical protein